MKALLLSFLLALFVFGIAPFAKAEPPKSFSVGEVLSFYSFCVADSPKFIRKFTDVLVRYGMSAYKTLVLEKDFPCYDYRAQTNIAFPLKLTLVKRLWAFELPSGEQLVMWKVKDTEGALGYGWTPATSGTSHEKVTEPVPGKEA